MAGYIIHLSIGEEYIRQHPNEIKNYDEFIEGIMYPDSVKEKYLTHCGPKSSNVHLDEFFEKRDIKTDFEKGYFLHLITDYLFYNKFLHVFNKFIVHNDYDLTNRQIEDEFKVKVPDKIKPNVFYKEGIPQILNVDKTKDFVRSTAKLDLETTKQSILNGDKYWLTIDLPAKI